MGLVIFDARRSCEVRLVRERGPVRARGAQADHPRGAGPAGGAAPGVTVPPDEATARRHRRRTGSGSTSAAPTASSGRPRCSGTRRTSRGSTRSGWASAAAWYAERGLAWVVRAMELAVLAPIPLGTTLDLSTEVTGLPQGVGAPPDARDGCRRRRGWSLWAHTDWVMTDASAACPGRVPPRDPGRVRRAGRAASSPARVPLPSPRRTRRRTRSACGRQDIDPMDHVNNAAYVDYLEESLLAAGATAARVPAAIPRRIRLEYLVARGARRRARRRGSGRDLTATAVRLGVAARGRARPRARAGARRRPAADPHPAGGPARYFRTRTPGGPARCPREPPAHARVAPLGPSPHRPAAPAVP